MSLVDRRKGEVVHYCRFMVARFCFVYIYVYMGYDVGEE